MPDKQTQIQPPVYTDLTNLENEIDMIGLEYQYYIASPFFAGFKNFGSSDWKIFLSVYTGLSLNIKNFITAPETAEAIFKIGTDNGLEDNQIYRTSELMRDFLLGKIFIKDLPYQLMQKINIDEAKSAKIINEIVSQLFSPIIEDIKRIQRSKFPDKISQLQKESQPTVMTQPTARPLSPRPENQPQRPLSQLSPTPQKTGPRINPAIPLQPQSAPQQTRPVIPPQPQAVRPPQPVPIQAPIQIPPQPPRPLSSPSTNIGGGEVRPQNPPIQPPSRPQFKVPNMSNDLSGIRVPPSTPSGKAEESLEKELEKVANVIDLRNKPE